MAELQRGDAGPELNQYNTDSARASERVGGARRSLHTARRERQRGARCGEGLTNLRFLFSSSPPANVHQQL